MLCMGGFRVCSRLSVVRRRLTTVNVLLACVIGLLRGIWVSDQRHMQAPSMFNARSLQDHKISGVLVFVCTSLCTCVCVRVFGYGRTTASLPP
jgi:hypothetical protein